MNKLNIRSVVNSQTPKLIKRKLLGYNTTDGWIWKLFVYILLIGISYVFLYPLLRMISMSLMSAKDIIDPEVYWLPKHFSLSNYGLVIKAMGIFPKIPTTLSFNAVWTSLGILINSIVDISILAVAQTLVSALTGFAFARFKFRFKNLLFFLMIASFIIPVQLVTIPRMMMIEVFQDKISGPIAMALTGIATNGVIVNTLIPQVTFTLFGQGTNSAILILIFYNFFRMIPISLDEAARMDGATSWQVFWNIYIKLVLPIITTVFLFSFVWNWNDTFSMSMYNSTMPSITMKLDMFDQVFGQVASSTSGPGGTGIVRMNEAYKMAATLISMLPLFVLYLFTQRQFIEGIERTGITGE